MDVDHQAKYLPKQEELRQSRTSPHKELKAPTFKIERDHSFTGLELNMDKEKPVKAVELLAPVYASEEIQAVTLDLTIKREPFCRNLVT